jgi:outer membrane biosynthesis protein TonB
MCPREGGGPGWVLAFAGTHRTLMDRAEKIGLGVAGAGHLILFGLLSIGFLATPNPEKLKITPVEISLAKDVALEQTSPAPAEEPAQSVAPEEGLPEDAPPPAEPEPDPAPAPPEPAPPQPASRPAPPKPQPAPPPKPAPVSRPKPPKPAAKPAAKPAPEKPTRSASAKPAKPTPAKPAAASKGSGRTENAKADKPRGSRLGPDFLKGLSPEPSTSRNPNPPGKVGAQAAANIASAIQRQIQPCANRQVTPGPGAERIRVAINLRINRDGSLAGRPTVRGHTGVDDQNERYVARVDDLAIAAFVGCAPLTGLPPELYDVPGGWRNFTLRYKLPG